ncbi:MAG: hypothetical protein NTV34_02140, partial [Proteobacteria bacterium]|nr:hypothetical protein [Pseudomonadota bacterium]
MKIETLFRIGLLGFAASTLLRCSDGAPSRISDAGSGMPSVSEPAKTDQATKSPENTDPKLKSQGLSIAEGDEASLKSLLVLTDQEDTDDNLEFTIVSDPLLGFIKRSGSKIGVGQTFTQKD